jgi:hypothetical protein
MPGMYLVYAKAGDSKMNVLILGLEHYRKGI